jgi:D-inositol-3-phosphate glycosyltransferase
LEAFAPIFNCCPQLDTRGIIPTTLDNPVPRGDNHTMRIAMLSYHTCPLATLGGKEAGGMNVYVRELVRALGRRGVGADVYTRSQDEHVPHVLHDLGYGNRVVHVPCGPEHPLPKDELPNYLADYVSWIKNFSETKGLEYDVIHSHYWLSGEAAMSLRDEWGLPIVQMFHTLGEMKNQVARSPNEIASPARLSSERLLLSEADKIIASTEAELTQFRWLYHQETDKVEIIEPGVDTSHFYPIPADEAREFVEVTDDRRIILFVGRIEPLKGLDSLLSAIALLDQLGQHDLHLMVIGGEPDADPEEITVEMDRLQAMTRELKLDDQVTFLGKRDQDVLQYYYSAAEIVVMPSHYESFGLVALEAMACGTPVVASETGGLVFLVKDGETGLHVPTAAPQALADKLQRLLENEAELGRLGHQAAKYARSFEWGKVADRMIQVYEELAQSPVQAQSAGQ